MIITFFELEKAKFCEIIAFARERSEWEKVADRPDEGSFFPLLAQVADRRPRKRTL